MHGRVADDVITRQQQLDMQITASKLSRAFWWQEEKGVSPSPPLPPGELVQEQATLQTQFNYLLCHLMYIHVHCFDELILTVISWAWHDAIVNIQHRLSSLIRGNVPVLKNSRWSVVLSSIAKAAGR